MERHLVVSVPLRAPLLPRGRPRLVLRHQPRYLVPAPCPRQLQRLQLDITPANSNPALTKFSGSQQKELGPTRQGDPVICRRRRRQATASRFQGFHAAPCPEQQARLQRLKAQRDHSTAPPLLLAGLSGQSPRARPPATRQNCLYQLPLARVWQVTQMARWRARPRWASRGRPQRRALPQQRRSARNCRPEAPGWHLLPRRVLQASPTPKVELQTSERVLPLWIGLARVADRLGHG